MEYSSQKNQKDFWNKVHRLGPNVTTFKNKTVKINGKIIDNPEQIRQKWFDEFSKLYSGSPYNLGHLRQTFYNCIISLLPS